MWSLFLDRDGVLNRRIPDGYVRRVDELEVLEGVGSAVAALSALARRVVVVTNQAGVGRGLMTMAAVDAVNSALVEHVRRHGGRVDAVFTCPHLAGVGCGCRKPSPGMAWQAVARFPEIDLGRSVMVGDSPSDCAFAEAAGMRSVLIGQRSWTGAPHPWSEAPDLLAAVPDLLRLMSG